jgi:hypothetical protein
MEWKKLGMRAVLSLLRNVCSHATFSFPAVGMTEANAKFRYIQLCRGLKTYGITCFEVLEKNPKTRKTQPVLIGVTKGV